MKPQLLSLFLTLTYVGGIPVTLAQSNTPLRPSDLAMREAITESAEITINDDYYAAGRDVEMKVASRGDTLLAGKKVWVSKIVGKDLAAAGQEIVIDAVVRDDARAAGEKIAVNQSIGGDLLAFGDEVVIRSNVRITGDAFIYANKVRIDGVVHGKLTVKSEELVVNGTVDGIADVRSNKVLINGRLMNTSTIAAIQFFVGEKALFGSHLHYWRAGGPLELGNKVKGQARYDLMLQREEKESDIGKALPFLIGAFSAFSILSAAVIIGIFILISKKYLVEVARKLKRGFWMSLLKGVLFYVVTPIAVILLTLTIIGFPIAMILLAMYAIMLLLAKPLAALIWVKYVEAKYKKEWNRWLVLLFSVLGFILLKILSMIPFIGWIACAVIVWSAMGAVLAVKWEKAKKML